MSHLQKLNCLEKMVLGYYPYFYKEDEAWIVFKKLQEEINWKHEKIKVFGKEYWQPRLTRFYAENELPYTYSNLKMHPKRFGGSLQDVKKKIEQKTGTRFTSCLANLYRDGQDSNGWHSDDEKELGRNPVIASLSLGASRNFKFRSKDNHRIRFAMNLRPGGLLIMKGETQHFWQHQLPKTKREVSPRINLTFRVIK